MITTIDIEVSTIDLNAFTKSNVFWFEEVFLDNLSRLVEVELAWDLLPLKENVELILATVLVVDFPDLESVVGQEVVHDVRTVIEYVELKDFPVIFEKLFLIPDSSPPQSVFSVLLHVIVTHRDKLDIGLLIEGILGLGLGGLLGPLVELAGVVITVGQVDGFAVNVNGAPHHEVIRGHQQA